MAVDKKAIVNQLLRGYGVPIETLLAPPYTGFDPEVTTPYDPEGAAALLAKSGYSREKPVEFKIQTTRGYIAKDYEVIQAIVGMWRRIGIRAEIEVYEIAKHFELRAQDQLAPAAFYNWGNSIGDPSTSTGHAMFGPSPHSTWDTEDLDAMIGPLWVERTRPSASPAGRRSTAISPRRPMSSRCISRSSRWCTRRALSSRATSPTSSCPRRCRRLRASPPVTPPSLPEKGGAVEQGDDGVAARPLQPGSLVASWPWLSLAPGVRFRRSNHSLAPKTRVLVRPALPAASGDSDFVRRGGRSCSSCCGWCRAIRSPC